MMIGFYAFHGLGQLVLMDIKFSLLRAYSSRLLLLLLFFRSYYRAEEKEEEVGDPSWEGNL